MKVMAHQYNIKQKVRRQVSYNHQKAVERAYRNQMYRYGGGLIYLFVLFLIGIFGAAVMAITGFLLLGGLTVIFVLPIAIVILANLDRLDRVYFLIAQAYTAKLVTKQGKRDHKMLKLGINLVKSNPTASIREKIRIEQIRRSVGIFGISTLLALTVVGKIVMLTYIALPTAVSIIYGRWAMVGIMALVKILFVIAGFVITVFVGEKLRILQVKYLINTI